MGRRYGSPLDFLAGVRQLLLLKLTAARDRWLADILSSPMLWCVAATIFCILVPLGLDIPALADRLGDSDDALRLVGVRDLVAGGAWFDATVARIGAPEPLLSHWSRLVDLPLAIGLVLLRPLFGAEGAELALRVLWPAILLFGLLCVVARDAFDRGGGWACLFAILFTVTCDSALTQFRPGRIDHHNIQILCAVAGLLLLARSFEDSCLGLPAGLSFGIGLAVGLEAIALAVPALALASAIGLWQPRSAPGVRNAAIAMSATLLAAFLLTTPPARWLDIRCDTLSLNLVLLTGFCSAGLWAAQRLSGADTAAARCAIAGVLAAFGLVLYAWLDPACLAGPMGQLNPALKAIWLDEVVETRSASWLIVNHPAAGLTFLAFVMGGTAAQLALFRRKPDAVTGFSTAVVVLAVLLGFWQVRLMSYASWLVIPSLAVWCAGLRHRAAFSNPFALLGATLLLSQTVMGVVMTTAVAAVRHVSPASITAPGPSANVLPCYASSSVRPLAALPPGLVAADIDLGPFVVATTPHRVLAAPYHRLDKGILANHALLDGPPDQARKQINMLEVDYVGLCAVQGQKATPGSLRALLLAGQTVPFLREAKLGADGPVRFWRVVRP
jgi:hypothetical protein